MRSHPQVEEAIDVDFCRSPHLTHRQIDSIRRSADLFRWNAILAALHLVQGLAILAISFAKSPVVTSPIVSTYLRFDEATRHLVTAQRSIWDLPIGPAVALFFLMSAVAHFTMAFPARRWYEARLARGQNPIRWIEYSFSSSVMIVVIAALAGVRKSARSSPSSA